MFNTKTLGIIRTPYMSEDIGYNIHMLVPFFFFKEKKILAYNPCKHMDAFKIKYNFDNKNINN